MTEWINDNEGVARAQLNVPPDTFDAMLERAAKHRGYFGGQHDVHEIVTRDAVLQQSSHCSSGHSGHQGHSGQPGQGPDPARARVIFKQLVEARPFEGTPLLVRTYHRKIQPFSAFPCDAPVHSKRKIRRLKLKVHQDAHLVFDVMVSDPQGGYGIECMSNRVVRRVYLEIEKRDKSDPDLRRTIENTIQVVMLGMTPQGKGVQMGQIKK